jgi:two-component system cell cycle response regulator DivK
MSQQDTKGTILYIEDNADNRTLVRRILHAEDYEFTEAKNASDALVVLKTARPNLILMDINMPDMDGYEATEAIHAHRRGKKIPVVAVSGDCIDCEYASGAFNAVFIACLGKPWEEEVLLQIVSTVLEPHLCF